MNLTCDIVMDMAVLYNSKNVSGGSAEEIENHLRQCPACRKFYNLRSAGRKISDSVGLAEDSVSSYDYAGLSKRLKRRRIIGAVLTTAAIGIAAAVAVTSAVKYAYSGKK